MPLLSFSGFLGYYILIFQLLFLLFLFRVFITEGEGILYMSRD